MQEQIVAYWFGEDGNASEIANRQAALWWGKSEQTDQEIKARFGEALSQAEAGELNDWADSASGRLALIILFDQFTRNIYRDSAKAFASDDRALKLCLDGMDCGHDTELPAIQRVFFYLPLEHSESLAMQERSVAAFAALRDSVGADDHASFAGFFDFAIQHQKIIERFGRYPHRNVLLGRESTAEELAFLQEPGSSF